MILCFLIPAYNEAKVIRRSILGCYKAGVRPADVYVVDDGSQDNTAAVARHYHAQVLSLPNAGKSTALEQGLQHFNLTERYTHIAVLDADSIIDPSYPAAMEAAIERHPNAVLFCGRQRSQHGPWNWLTAYRAVDYAVWCGIYREAQHALGTINVAPGFASLYHLPTFASLDFHGGTVVEDMDMTMQLQRAGKTIVYVPDAIVTTQDPRTLPDFIRQVMRWYRGTWQVIKKYRLGRRAHRVDLEVGTLVVEQLVMSLAVLGLPLWYYLSPVFVFWCLAADQTIALTYAILTAIRERRPELVLLFPTFVIPRLLSYVLFPWACLAERRSHDTRWVSPARY